MITTRSQRRLRSMEESAGPQSNQQNLEVPTSAGQSRTMPRAAKNQAGTKRQGANLELDLAKCPKRAPQLKILREVAKKLQELEDVQDTKKNLGAELANAESQVKGGEKENKGLLGEIAHLSADVSMSDRKIERMGRENADLKVDLLKQQPRAQLPDSRIVEMYHELRGNISSWLDNEVPILRAEWREVHHETCAEFSLFGHGTPAEDLAFLGNRFTFGEEYLVESIIHTQLQRLLFEIDSPFFALDENEVRFLRATENGFGLLDPPKGKYLRKSMSIKSDSNRYFEYPLFEVRITQSFHHVSVVPGSSKRDEVIDRTQDPYGFWNSTARTSQ